jgi:hypothetical protein
MGISLCRARIGMAKQRLDYIQTFAVIHQKTCERVAKIMQAEIL